MPQRLLGAGGRGAAVVSRNRRANRDDVSRGRRNCFRKSKRRRSQIHHRRRSHPGGKIANQAVIGGVFRRCGGLLALPVTLATRVRGSRNSAGLTAFAGQRNNPTAVPGHNDVEPHRLDQQQRDPESPPTHCPQHSQSQGQLKEKTGVASFESIPAVDKLLTR